MPPFTQKVTQTAKQQAINSAKQIAKTGSFEAKKIFIDKPKEQLTGIPDTNSDRAKETGPLTNPYDSQEEKAQREALARQRMNEFRQEIEQIRLRKLKEKQEQIIAEQQAKDQNVQKETNNPFDHPKPKGRFGKAAASLKNKLSSMTSKAEKKGRMSG